MAEAFTGNFALIIVLFSLLNLSGVALASERESESETETD